MKNFDRKPFKPASFLGRVKPLLDRVGGHRVVESWLRCT
jgi:hypothetical protein